jgi:hypothetical protein
VNYISTWSRKPSHLANCFGEVSRDLLAAPHQYSTDGKNGTALFLRHPDPQGTWGSESLGQQVENCLFQCRQQNSANGKIISISHRQTQQALEFSGMAGDARRSATAPPALAKPRYSRGFSARFDPPPNFRLLCIADITDR